MPFEIYQTIPGSSGNAIISDDHQYLIETNSLKLNVYEFRNGFFELTTEITGATSILRDIYMTSDNEWILGFSDTEVFPFKKNPSSGVFELVQTIVDNGFTKSFTNDHLTFVIGKDGGLLQFYTYNGATFSNTYNRTDATKWIRSLDFSPNN